MSSAKLKEDLNNCIITFDRRIALTELLDDYNLTYDEVNQVVLEHLKKQEEKNKLKYEKRFLVHGVQDEGENKKEIFQIVGEKNLKEWLQKLQNAESSLYSVEVTGGAKSAAPIFKPMKLKENVKLRERKAAKAKASDNNGTMAQTSKNSGSTNKIEVKKETKNSLQESPASKTIKDTPKSSIKTVTPVKKTSPKMESSPKAKKTADKKTVNSKKGGINNFFAPVANKKTDVETKDSNPQTKPPTPKKVNDFFKKQTEKPKTITATESLKTTANHNKSIQLFESEDEEKDEPADESSDEEEKIEALKRDIISSDVEMEANEEETDDKPSTSAKRRRILDSDDEDEDPPVKQEKLDVETDVKEEEIAEPETYLDEEGFVITKKPKQKSSTAKSATAIKTTPAVTLKTSPKESKNASLKSTTKDKKGAGNSAAKTKQAGIMNFFSKK